ncbi:hypothetical protein [Neobacillus sp. PS3-40]|uniref:hypothetical protein n=1 Tax=Neobacillus sp. PS3-40 TaxID=3070679 RepID=UPI0027E0C99C|nr:hypothetical protein [Neobacillus sp. PS3-40]WML45023.1 hypothetical protein RCG20_03735 [Neobacillus sp. PS3-40]
MERFVALHRNQFGDIISFVTSLGRIISYKKAIIEVESGLIEGVLKKEDLEGNAYLMPELQSSFDDLPNTF